MTRDALLADLSALICQAARPGHITRTGIDGLYSSGKTTLANELVGPLEDLGHVVIRASTSGFRGLSSIPGQAEESDPGKYYNDSYDHVAIRKFLLQPFGPSGDRKYKPALFDPRTGAQVDIPFREAPPDAILILDGEFLNRPELQAFWDFRIFVKASAHICLKRTLLRDNDLAGGPLAVMERFEKKYLPADRLYNSLVRPEDACDVTVYNDRIAESELKLSRWVKRTEMSRAASPGGK